MPVIRLSLPLSVQAMNVGLMLIADPGRYHTEGYTSPMGWRWYKTTSQRLTLLVLINHGID